MQPSFKCITCFKLCTKSMSMILMTEKALVPSHTAECVWLFHDNIKQDFPIYCAFRKYSCPLFQMLLQPEFKMY